jgi:hypothetical protein
MATPLGIALSRARQSRCASASAWIARRSLEGRPSQAARSPFFLSLCFPYAGSPNPEWIPYPHPAQEGAVNLEAHCHG